MSLLNKNVLWKRITCCILGCACQLRCFIQIPQPQRWLRSLPAHSAWGDHEERIPSNHQAGSQPSQTCFFSSQGVAQVGLRPDELWPGAFHSSPTATFQRGHCRITSAYSEPQSLPFHSADASGSPVGHLVAQNWEHTWGPRASGLLCSGLPSTWTQLVFA